MNKSILRLARQFINKELKRQLSFESVERYLRKSGYLVQFYNEQENTEIIQKYDLLEYSKTCDAFTINDDTEKFVFIRKTLSSQDMLYTLLHETGHIVLKHLDCNQATANKHIQEIEADTFVYGLLNNPTNKATWYLLALSVLFFVLSCFNIIGTNHNTKLVQSSNFVVHTTLASPTPVPTPTPTIQSQNELVYVTPSGKKYHRSGCRYLKDTKCTELTMEKAKNKYTACSVCRP